MPPIGPAACGADAPAALGVHLALVVGPAEVGVTLQLVTSRLGVVIGPAEEVWGWGVVPRLVWNWLAAGWMGEDVGFGGSGVRTVVVDGGFKQ